MMVQGRHFKDPLAMGQLKIAYLNDVGESLTEIDKPNKNQHQWHIIGESQRRHRAAQKQ